MAFRSLFSRLLGNKNFSKISNPQNAGGDMTKIPIGKTTQESGGSSLIGRLLGRSGAGGAPTGLSGDYISKTFKGNFKMKNGGIARGCGRVLKDRKKVTKYY
jgi:hypothetical protein